MIAAMGVRKFMRKRIQEGIVQLNTVCSFFFHPGYFFHLPDFIGKHSVDHGNDKIHDQ